MKRDIVDTLGKVTLAAMCMALIVACACATVMLLLWTGKCLIMGACS